MIIGFSPAILMPCWAMGSGTLSPDLIGLDRGYARCGLPRTPLPRTRVNRGRRKGRGVVPRPFTEALRLLEEVFEVALLLLGLTLPLVRATLSLCALVARESTAGFLDAALGPVHRSFVLVVPAAGHGYFLLRKLVGYFIYSPRTTRLN